MIIMLVLLAAVLASFFGIKKYKKTHTSSEESSETEYTITSMDASKADKFTVKTGDTSMSFSKSGDNWVYDDDKTVELDQTKMSGIVSSLYNSSSTIKIVNPSDLEQYGLGDGAMEIELSSGTTKTKITLGSFNQMISKFYIMKDGDKAVYAITGDELSNLSGGIDSLKAAADTSTAVQSSTAVGTSTAAESSTAEGISTSAESSTTEGTSTSTESSTSTSTNK